MIDANTKKHINLAVEEEKKAAIENHGPFKNHHEAWAVLREECQEVMERLNSFSNVTGNSLDLLWKDIRTDSPCEEENLKYIHNAAEALAEECIQVMAVCKKWQKLIDKESEESSEQNNVNRPADERSGAPVHPERPCSCELHPGS